jgi:hypothetical protein
MLKMSSTTEGLDSRLRGNDRMDVSTAGGFVIPDLIGNPVFFIAALLFD